MSTLRKEDPQGWRDYERTAADIREARMARSEGLADPDIRAVAVPVENAGGRVAGVLVVTARRHGAGDRSLAIDAAARRLLAALSVDA